MNLNLDNTTIVVTGSSKGIGSEFVKRFAKERANVVLNYFTSEDKAQKLFHEIASYNKNCLLVKADVRNHEDVKRLYQASVERFGKIDVLINNAGTCDDSLLPVMTEQQWRDVIELNLFGVFFCSRVFSRHMIKWNKGKIINIASLKGQVGSEGQTNYSTSKAGVIGFTKALARELGRFNICVNAVCPGFILTDMNKENNKKILSAREQNVLAEYHYLESLVDFLTFMVSEKFHSVSGQVFNLDSRVTA